MNTVQKIINARAAKKLDDELNTLTSTIWAFKLLKKPSEVKQDYPDGDYPYIQVMNDRKQLSAMTLHALSATCGNIFWKSIKQAWLPIYVEEETKLFLKEIDELKEQVSDLTGEIDDIRRNSNNS